MSPEPEKLEEFKLLELSREGLAKRLDNVFSCLISDVRKERHGWGIALIGFIVDLDCIHPLVRMATKNHFALGGKGLRERFPRMAGESGQYDVNRVLINWYGNAISYPVSEPPSPVELCDGMYIVSDKGMSKVAIVFSESQTHSTGDVIKQVAPDMEHLQALVSGLEAAGLHKKEILVEAGT